MRAKTISRIEQMIIGDYDFIKYVVSCIPGLEWLDNHYENATITLTRENNIEHYRVYSRSFRLLTYPLLLTRAVEGINELDPFKIDIFFYEPTGWNWSYKDHLIENDSYVSADSAKEAALLYVKSLNTPIDKDKLLTEIRAGIIECNDLLNEMDKQRPGTALYKRFNSYIEEAEIVLKTEDTQRIVLILEVLNTIRKYFKKEYINYV